MIVWMNEPWSVYRAECDALWAEHYDEIAADKHMAMAPDEPSYEASEAAGSLDVLVGREAGAMVGYVISEVRRHRHYCGTLVGLEDGYFLTKASRKGLAGLRMIQAWKARMAQRGCYRAFIMTKPFLDMGPLFKRLGAVHSDTVWAFTFKENA